MNYNEKKKIRKIITLEHEIEYYARVYKNCKKINILKERIEQLKKA